MIALQLPDPSTVFWDDWLLLLVQAAGVILLAIYVWKTWQMASATRQAASESRRAVEESRDARLESLAPRILVYFDPSDTTVASIVLHNAGAGTAVNLKLTFSPKLQTTEDEKVLAFFDVIQPSFAPGLKLTQFFGTWPKYFESDLPRRYEVTVTYQGAENGRAYRTVHVLDTDAIRPRVFVTRKTLHDLVKEVERFRRLLDQVSKKWDDRLKRNHHAAVLERSSDLNELKSISSLLVTIRFLHQVAAEREIHIDIDAAYMYLRREALNALRAAKYEHAPRDRVTALEGLALAIWRHHRWNLLEWLQSLAPAIAELEATFQRV